MHEYLPHLSDIAEIIERNPIKASIVAIAAINIAIASAGIIRFGPKERREKTFPKKERPAPVFAKKVGYLHRGPNGRTVISAGREMRIRRQNRKV